jgi:hypothetical protein
MSFQRWFPQRDLDGKRRALSIDQALIHQSEFTAAERT